MITASAGVGAFALIVSTVVGFGFHSFSSDISKGVEGPAGIVIFVLLSSLTTILLVLDDACIGLLRGDLQLRRNTVFAVSKLVLLPILILFWATSSGIELVLAWLAGLGISLLFMAYELLNLTKGQSSRLDFRRIFEKRTLMFRHHWLNLSVQAPRLILPILVAVIVSPQANAAFTATWLVVGFVQIIPSLLSTVLFALAPGDEEALHRECRKTMRISLVVSVVSAPFFFIFSGLILRVFGPQYAVAGTTMGILGLATYPGAIKSHYVAISRVRGKMQQAVFLTIIGVTLEVGFSAAGGALWGLNGVALGLLVGLVVEAFVYAPTVFGVLIEGRASRTISTEHVANIEEEATSPDRNMQ